MRKITIAGAESSSSASPEEAEDSSAKSPVWQTLETYARGKIQQFVQRLLEEEVDDLLGRKKSERRTLESAPGYRNGYAKPRKLALSSGTITVKRPWMKDLEERFASRLLPLFKRRTEEVGAMLPELYLHGLSLGDFELALRGLLGDAAPLRAKLNCSAQDRVAASVRHVEAARSLRSGARLPLGRRSLREGGAGAGQRGPAGHGRCTF